jgi:hypothetical protein
VAMADTLLEAPERLPLVLQGPGSRKVQLQYQQANHHVVCLDRCRAGGPASDECAYVSVSLTFSVVKNSITSPGLTSL